MKKIVLMVLGLLAISMLLSGCAKEISDAELKAALEELSDEELNALIDEGKSEEGKALAGQAYSSIPLTISTGTYYIAPSTLLATALIVQEEREVLTDYPYYPTIESSDVGGDPDAPLPTIEPREVVEEYPTIEPKEEPLPTIEPRDTGEEAFPTFP